MGPHLPGGCELQVLIRNTPADRQSPLFTQRALSFAGPAMPRPCDTGAARQRAAHRDHTRTLHPGRRRTKPVLPRRVTCRAVAPHLWPARLCRRDIARTVGNPSATAQARAGSARPQKARQARPLAEHVRRGSGFAPGPAVITAAHNRKITTGRQRTLSGRAIAPGTDAKKRRRCDLRPPQERGTCLSCAARNTPRAQATPVHRPRGRLTPAPAAPAPAMCPPAGAGAATERRD
jgi:hypothetical protein